jgi:hypothetical protein
MAQVWLPACARELSPVQPVWSYLKWSLASLANRSVLD